VVGVAVATLVASMALLYSIKQTSAI